MSLAPAALPKTGLFTMFLQGFARAPASGSPFNLRSREKIAVLEFHRGISYQDCPQARRGVGIAEPRIVQHIFRRPRPTRRSNLGMPTQIFHLRRKERVGDLPSRKTAAQPWGTVGHSSQEAVAGCHSAQFVEPIPNIHSKLLKRVSSTGHRASGPGSKVVPVVHGKGATSL